MSGPCGGDRVPAGPGLGQDPERRFTAYRRIWGMLMTVLGIISLP